MGYKRFNENKHRMEWLYKNTQSHYGHGAYRSESGDRYYRYNDSYKSGHTKYLRRISNKRVRRNKERYNHAGYKRIYDYWWQLF